MQGSEEESSSGAAGPGTGFSAQWEQFMKEEFPVGDGGANGDAEPAVEVDKYQRLYNYSKSLPWVVASQTTNTTNTNNTSNTNGRPQTGDRRSNIPKINDFEPTAKQSGGPNIGRLYNEYMTSLKRKQEINKVSEKRTEKKESKLHVPIKPWKLFQTAYDTFVENGVKSFDKFKRESITDDPLMDSLPMLVEDIIEVDNLENVINNMLYIVKENREAVNIFNQFKNALVRLTYEDAKFEISDRKEVKRGIAYYNLYSNNISDISNPSDYNDMDENENMLLSSTNQNRLLGSNKASILGTNTKNININSSSINTTKRRTRNNHQEDLYEQNENDNHIKNNMLGANQDQDQDQENQVVEEEEEEKENMDDSGNVIGKASNINNNCNNRYIGNTDDMGVGELLFGNQSSLDFITNSSMKSAKTKQNITEEMENLNFNLISKTVFIRFLKALFRFRYNKNPRIIEQIKNDNEKVMLMNYMNELFLDLSPDYENALDLFLNSTKSIRYGELKDYQAKKHYQNEFKERTPQLTKRAANEKAIKLFNVSYAQREAKERAEKEKYDQEIAGCTFRPVHIRSDVLSQAPGPKMSRDEFFKSLLNTSRKPPKVMSSLEQELLECTFKPNIISRNPNVFSISTSDSQTYVVGDERKDSYKTSPTYGKRYRLNWDDDKNTDKSGAVNVNPENRDFSQSIHTQSINESMTDPKGFIESVNRVRLANMRREQVEREKENLGKVDPALLKIIKNKSMSEDASLDEKNNNNNNNGILQPKPFKLRTDERSKNQRVREAKTLLHIDVKLMNGKVGRVSVKEGDTPKKLAAEFAKVYGLDDHIRDALEGVFYERMKDNGIV